MEYTARQSNKQGDWMVMHDSAVSQRGLTETDAKTIAEQKNAAHEESRAIVLAAREKYQKLYHAFEASFTTLADNERAWASWRNDYYGRLCYEAKRQGDADRAYTRQSAQFSDRPSFQRHVADLDEGKNTLNRSWHYYNTVIVPLDSAIKSARNKLIENGDSGIDYETQLTVALTVMKEAPMV
jgi:hypothetical protein